MGDRSNLFFRNGNGGIGVYGHWAGPAMAHAAAAVLANAAFTARVGDASYATRIGVQTALRALDAGPEAETGYGLWTHASGPDDNEYRFVVIDVDTGDCFVTDTWKAPTPSDKIAEPTAARIAAKMAAPATHVDASAEKPARSPKVSTNRSAVKKPAAKKPAARQPDSKKPAARARSKR